MVSDEQDPREQEVPFFGSAPGAIGQKDCMSKRTIRSMTAHEHRDCHESLINILTLTKQSGMDTLAMRRRWGAARDSRSDYLRVRSDVES